PLPILILAVVFLIVWNMDPVIEEESERGHVEVHTELTDYAPTPSSDPNQNETSSEEHEAESKATISQQQKEE
ncbi:MAG: hypothetical protein O2964_11200, partial [Verrucomicrobia bacterium]|nr:hypothetical protein [Verrucomicrobiota bacterium]